MFVVDASVWISRFVAGDAHYAPSHAWLESVIAAGEIIVAPAILLPEVAGGISRRLHNEFDGHRAVSFFDRLILLRLVSLDGNAARGAAAVASRLGLRGADATYVAIARQLRIPLVSWDTEQLTRASSLIEAHTPAQLLEAGA